MALRLKLKIVGHPDAVVSIDSNICLKDLAAVLKAHVPDGLRQQTLSVRAGVPPAAIDLSSDGTLGSVCKSGDILHVEFKNEVNTGATPSKSAVNAAPNSATRRRGASDDDIVAVSSDDDGEPTLIQQSELEGASGGPAALPRPPRAAAGLARDAIQAQIAEDEAKAKAVKKASTDAKANRTSVIGGGASGRKKARVDVNIAGAGHVLGHADDSMENVLDTGSGEAVPVQSGGSSARQDIAVTPLQPAQPFSSSARSPLSPQPLLAQLHSARLERHPELAAAHQQSTPGQGSGRDASARQGNNSSTSKRRHGPVMPSSEAGLEALLVGAGRGGSGGGSSGGKKLARAAFQEELDRRYEDAAANARLAAAQMGAFTVQRAEATSGKTRWAKTSAMTCAGTILVRYKGVGERSWREDVVDEILPMFVPAVLEAILQGNEDDSDAKQSLRPYRLANTPKFFWAAVRCGSAALQSVPPKVMSSSAQSAKPGGAGASSSARPTPSSGSAEGAEEIGVPTDVELALKALLPGHTAALDKLFGVRERRPSAKSRTHDQTAKKRKGGQDAAESDIVELDDDGEETAASHSALPSAIRSVFDSVTAEALGSVTAPASTPGERVEAKETAATPANATSSGPSHPHKHINDGPSVAELDVACLRAAAAVANGSSGHALDQSASSPEAVPSTKATVHACLTALAHAIGLNPALASHNDLSALELQTLVDRAEVQLGDLSAAEITSALCTFRKSRMAPVTTAAASNSGNEEAESQTFVCDSCGKNRIVASIEADLEAVAASDTWTCTSTVGCRGSSGIPSLLSRGGCAAPDDDLAMLAGSYEAAALLEAANFPSVRSVACTLLRDVDVLLYAGPSRALPQALQATTSEQSALGRSLAERIACRIPSPALLTDAVQGSATDELLAVSLPPQAEAALAELHAKKQLGGGKLSPQAYIQSLPLLARGHSLLYVSARWLLGSDPARFGDTNSSQAAHDLLCNPVGLACASALAHSWRSAAVVDQREEELAAVILCPLAALAQQAIDIVQGKGGDSGHDSRAASLAKQAAEEAQSEIADDVAERVTEIVEQRLSESCRDLLTTTGLDVTGPADLLLYEGQEAALLSTLLALARSTGMDSTSVICLEKYLRVEDVQAWLTEARSRCTRHLWLPH